jgi:hypothetical protein
MEIYNIKLISAEVDNLNINLVEEEEEIETDENPSVEDIKGTVSDLIKMLRDKDTDGETYYGEQPIPLIISCLENGWFLVTDEEDNLLYNPFRETSVVDKGKRLKELHDQIENALNEVEIITRAFNDLSKEEVLDKTEKELDNEISLVESSYEKETAEMYKRKEELEKELDNEISLVESSYEKETAEMYKRKEELEKELNEVYSKLESVKKDTEKAKDRIERSRNLMSEDVIEYAKGDE